MTSEQNQKIIDYLLFKKLPIDVLVEIHNHFVAQINDFESEMNFEDAFKQAKTAWSKDLGYAKDEFTGLDGTKFTNKLNWQIQKDYLRKGLKFAVIPFVFFGILALVLPLTYFEFCLYTFVALFLFSLIFLMVKQYKLMYKLNQKYDNYNLSIYRSQTALYGMLGAILPQMAFYAERVFAMYHDFINLNFSWISILVLFLTLGTISFIRIIYINYSDLEKSYQKIQPFLQYLVPNRFYVD